MSATGHEPPLPVAVADQEVESENGVPVVVAVGMLHRPPVHVRDGLAAVAGELPGHIDELVRRDAGLLRPPLHLALHDDIAQEGKARLVLDALDLAFGEKVADQGGIFSL